MAALWESLAKQVTLDGFVYHVVDNGARRVERACRFSCRILRFGIVRSQEVLENPAKQFGVEGDDGIGGRVLFDGEVVLLKQVDEAWLVFILIEEENVGNKSPVLVIAVGRLGGIAAEAVVQDVVFQVKV